ncbi:hypothetical protein Hypma_014387 [Hypsizygus marmoreus]|uniref:F-box domain-containing protein n=1 Tax=Hypsizygus marmoreus TaxID=39966 RepID=A0A369JEF4_HYPMA|nr:hypothetical protein Hypma_014387 [Hypsizygus marmoreus]
MNEPGDLHIQQSSAANVPESTLAPLKPLETTLNNPRPTEISSNILARNEETPPSLDHGDTLDSRPQADTHDLPQIQTYEISSSYIRKLPNELTSEIFQCCLVGPISIPWRVEMAPLNLSQVCSRWRQIALATGILWADIAIVIDAELYGAVGFAATGVEIIRRCGQSLISLRLELTGDWLLSSTQPFTEILLSNASRWKRLFLSGRLEWLEPFFALPPGSVDSLQVLEVRNEGPTSLSSLPLVQGAKSLSEFICSHNMTAEAISCLPLSQLTSLHLLRVLMGSDTLLSVLNQCTSLVQGVFVVRSQDIDPHTTTQPSACTLPLLKTLYIILMCPGDFGWLQWLNLPSLAHFELTAQLGAPFISSLVPTISSSRRLRTLCLCVIISPSDLEEILEAAPLLVTLEVIRGRMLSRSVLDRMASGELVPQLASLFCAIEALDGLSPHLDMLESRKEETTPAAHIDEVTFYDEIRGNFHSEDLLGLGRVQRLVKDGWDITSPWTDGLSEASFPVSM